MELSGVENISSEIVKTLKHPIVRGEFYETFFTDDFRYVMLTLYIVAFLGGAAEVWLGIAIFKWLAIYLKF